MKKKVIVLLTVVIAVAGICAVIHSLILTNIGKNNENSFDFGSGAVANFNDIKNEKLLNAVLTNQGPFWELKDDGADNWFQSTLTFTIDGLIASNTYTAYIETVGDGETYGGGYWVIYDGAGSETPLASQEAVEEPVRIQFTPTTSSIRVAVSPAGSYLWEKGIRSAHFSDFRIENELAVDSSGFSGKTCVCLGDSVTGFMDPPNDYPSVLASNTGMTVYNCGFEGCRMSDTHPDAAHKAFGAVPIADAIATGSWARQDSYVNGIYPLSYPQEHLNNLKAVDWLKVDFVTIFYGGNDAGNYVDIDNPQDPMDTTTYVGAARYVYNRIHTAYPNIKIMFFVPMYRYWIDEKKDSNEMIFEMGGATYHYYDWGDALLAASSSIGVPVVDMYRTLGINAANRTVFLLESDQTHPSEAGDKLIASKFEEQLFSEFFSK